MHVRALPTTYPLAARAIPSSTVSAGRYLMRFARTEEDLDRIFRLRYQVYQLELNIGLDAGHADARDEDEFDRRFHHLLIEERESREVVGTYRMQTAEMAAEGGYASGERFALEALPAAVRAKAVEVGRGCIAKPHRNSRVLHLLWRQLASYLTWNEKTVVFGSCPLSSQDGALALTMHRHLERLGACHPTLRVAPRKEFDCVTGDQSPVTSRRLPTPKIPALFQAYLTLGAKLLGPPAIDRDFKTIDWLLLLDVNDLDRLTYRSFFR